MFVTINYFRAAYAPSFTTGVSSLVPAKLKFIK